MQEYYRQAGIPVVQGLVQGVTQSMGRKEEAAA